MQTIALPKKIEFKKGDSDFEGKITIEPCFPGYGITLGNSLRRVLLSSLPGAAPVGIKIKGVDHEFMAMPHLKEDILEFILNLKKLRLKVMTDETVKLELEVHGEHEIKAGDIKKNSQVEIVNPELVLGHITDMSGHMEAEIFVRRGMGYETIESREQKENEIGYIEMDSIFSPVLKAGIRIENVRVGKMTNWDKIILDIVTDGTLDPVQAFKHTVEILTDQYNALIDNLEKKSEPIANQPEEKTEEDGVEIVEEKLTVPEPTAEVEKNEEIEKIAEEKEVKVSDETEDKPKKKRGRPKKS